MYMHRYAYIVNNQRNLQANLGAFVAMLLNFFCESRNLVGNL
jgi:hypothetical protein